MTLEEYQRESKKTAIYPQEHRIVYPTLGLTGEAGEVAEKIKKLLRLGLLQNIEAEQMQGIAKELGDVLWYLAQLATELGLDLEQIAKMNLEKLASRQERNVLHSAGDNR